MTSFRRLKADEIQCRVATISENGVSILLYKDARCDMNILDETVGCDMWQCRYYECKGNLYCSVGIKVGNEWIWKDNCGTESVTEKEKGEASDSFKRACFTWGIGRELYTAPYIWIPSEYVEIFTNSKGKKATNDKFIVSKIEYDSHGKINGLAIWRKARGQRKSERVFVLMPKKEDAPK